MQSKDTERLKKQIKENIINLQKLLEKLETNPKVIEYAKATREEFGNLRYNLVGISKVEILKSSVLEYWIALLTDQRNPYTHTLDNVHAAMDALDEVKDELSADLGIEV
ncbi:MAG: hypothetical protein JSW30_02075 [Dehalococcoidia bacterium]|nr:MAG: hypothetical protein JSW30_02075 [Dehalococcoidia bacterium]